MNRELIKEVMSLAGVIETAIGSLPYRDAVPALRALDEIRTCVSDELPGGEYVECQFCEEPKGIDEMVSGGDDGEPACTDCVKRWAASEKAVSHGSETKR